MSTISLRLPDSLHEKWTTAVMATTAPRPAPTTSTVAGTHANLSPEQQKIYQADVRAQQGREAMSYIVAAHRLLSRVQLRQIEQMIEEHYDDLTNAWREHFPT